MKYKYNQPVRVGAYKIALAITTAIMLVSLWLAWRCSKPLNCDDIFRSQDKLICWKEIEE